jgi:hypothetical protein
MKPSVWYDLQEEQEADEMWTVPLWPSNMNEPRDQDTGPRQHEETNEQEADSAIAAIHENNKPEEISRLLVHHRGGQQEQQVADSVNVTIGTSRNRKRKQQESTVPLWPSTAIADSAMVAIGTTRYGQCHCSHPKQQQEEPTVLTKPSVWCEVRSIPAQQEWIFEMELELQESTVPLWPSTTIDSRQCQSDHRRTTNRELKVRYYRQHHRSGFFESEAD